MTQETLSAQAGDVLATLETNGFGARPVQTIALATVAGMGLMMLCILLGLHPFVSMAGLLAGILLTLGTFAGRMEYRLTRSGLERQFDPFLGQILPLKRQHQVFAFADILSYKLETDLSRSMQEVETLRLQVRIKPYSIWISDQINPDGFRVFADQFLAAVSGVNHKVQASTKPQGPKLVPILRKPSFYESKAAKVLTVLFLWASFGLVAATFRGQTNLSHVVRIGTVLLPGTAYMTYRVFLKRPR